MSIGEVPIVPPTRWDVPFDEAMTAADVEKLLQREPFCRMEAGRFPKNLPLKGILRNDTRIIRFAEGDLIVREGDYGNSAFMLLEGEVRVALDRLPVARVPQPTQRSFHWRGMLQQLLPSQQLPEVRSEVGRPPGRNPFGFRGEGKSTHLFLQDLPRVLDGTRTTTIEAGEFFGELAAMTKMPRTATVFAVGEPLLLEIRWQGLRDLMRWAPALREHLESLYRRNSLMVHLREMEVCQRLDDEELVRLAAAIQFESHGYADWYRQTQKSDVDPRERIVLEPLVAEEGTPVTDLLLIRSGFARVSRQRGEGHQPIAYLGKGQSFGFDEFLTATDATQPTYRYSLRAVGTVDVLKIPGAIVRELLLPKFSPAERQQLASLSSQHAFRSDVEEQPIPEAPAALLNFLVDQRVMNGTSAMVIDLERCTRCDECVRACAATHEGNPRFVREGPRYERFQIANACMHCVDPVCMIGCPTGAIARDIETGIVKIAEEICVGCKVCATNCPYDCIRMVEIRNAVGQPIVDLTKKTPILKATKCDFCADSLGFPACQNACAHEALVRIDLSKVHTAMEWMNR